MSDFNEKNRQEQIQKGLLGTDGQPLAKPWGQGFIGRLLLFLFSLALLAGIGLTPFVLIQLKLDQGRPSNATVDQLK